MVYFFVKKYRKKPIESYVWGKIFKKKKIKSCCWVYFFKNFDKIGFWDIFSQKWTKNAKKAKKILFFDKKIAKRQTKIRKIDF